MKAKAMTAGKPAGLMLSFMLPMLLGNLLQQVYGLVDTMVVGRFVGTEALAAVGAAGTVDWVVIGSAVSLTQGFSVLMGQRFGAGDYPGLRHALAMSVYLCAGVSLGAAGAGLWGIDGLLRLLRTPADILASSRQYLSVLFLGLPVVLFYNLLSAVLRALGDSRSPLIAMALSSALNILLDLCFVAGLGRGVAGAAAATVLAQLFACLACLWMLRRARFCRLSRADWAPERATLLRLAALGFPLALQNCVAAGGGMISQFIVNGYGTVFVAGFTAAHRISDLLEQVGLSLGNTVSAYTGQNWGARLYGRVRRGVRTGFYLAAAAAAVCGAPVFLLRGPILSLIFPRGETAAVQVASDYLGVLCLLLVFLYLLYLFRSALQGMGDTLTPLLSGGWEMVIRVVGILALPPVLGKTGVYLSKGAGWFAAALLAFFGYLWRRRRMEETLSPKGSA